MPPRSRTKHAQSLGVSPQRLERLIGDADDLFRTFHQKDPKKDHLVPVLWPEEWSVLDRALRTGYLSNKWHSDKKWVAYTHLHTEDDAPEPVVLIPRKPEHRGVLERWGRSITPNPVLTWLALCLDIELARDRGTEQHLDFKEMPKMPHLCAVKGKKYLFVISQDPKDRGEMYALWSPQLEITEHGIIN